MTNPPLLLVLALGIASAGCAVHVHDGYHPRPTGHVVRAVHADARVHYHPGYGQRHARHPAPAVARRAPRPDRRAADPRPQTPTGRRPAPRSQPDEPAGFAAHRGQPSRRQTDEPGRRDRNRAESQRGRSAQPRGRSTDPVPPPGRPRVRDFG
jgi:hypothetical protein